MSGRREPSGAPSNASSAPRQNSYFVPRDGIDREVITADICRYLGRDALVRPGTYPDPQTGQLLQGYHITAYRNLTSAMIQDLKNDSARWESERRKHSSGGSSRYGGSYGGAQGPSQYPGSDAPGYSGSSGQQSFQQPQEYGSQAAHGYGNPNYPPQGQQIYPGQAGYVSQAQTGSTTAYGGQSATYGGYSQQDPPYVNVGANRESMPVDASSGRVYPSGYPPQQQPPPQQPQQVQDPRYYGQASTGTYAQPVDPLYGRSSYQTSQPEYSSSATAPVYHQQYVSETPQYENQNQTPPPRAVTSPSTSTQAQTGNSGSSHPRHHHRDRDTRDGSYSKSDRHSRR